MLFLLNRNHGLILRRYLNTTRRSFSQRKTRHEQFYSKCRKVISPATVSLSIIASFAGLTYQALESLADVTPITKRKRYIWMSRDAAAEDRRRYHDAVFGHSLLNHDSKQATRTRNICDKIISSNRDELEKKDFRIEPLCFESPRLVCCSLSDGKVYMSTGMLNTFTNDDELAFVLCHEIAHALLNHDCERLTLEAYHKGRSWFCPAEKGRSADLPLSTRNVFRLTELEADDVAFQFLTKSGYRTSEAISWLKRMQVMGADYDIPTPEKNSVEEVESTYPSFERRWNSLECRQWTDSIFVPRN
ncbi:Metalloendopeptidase OMA1, mitochondrial [Halotydeus destructor]|nr:Metalloendopeptidase OMA1, mitochondrial [Halotydeus destructor]